MFDEFSSGGFKGRISSADEGAIQSRQARQISFEEPDAIMVIETVGHGAGVCFLTREEKERYSFVRIG